LSELYDSQGDSGLAEEYRNKAQEALATAQPP
jgi:hypothetical protein